jgi:hypothetical protein
MRDADGALRLALDADAVPGAAAVESSAGSAPAAGSVVNGVVLDDGDGTVPLLSLGYMCARGWRGNRALNPAGARTTVREFFHAPTASVFDMVRAVGMLLVCGGAPRLIISLGVCSAGARRRRTTSTSSATTRYCSSSSPSPLARPSLASQAMS